MNAEQKHKIETAIFQAITANDKTLLHSMTHYECCFVDDAIDDITSEDWDFSDEELKDHIEAWVENFVD